MFALCSPYVFADSRDGCYLKQNCTVWADVMYGDIEENYTQVTIRTPQGTVIVDHQNMTRQDNETNSLYRYTFISNTTGNHYVRADYVQ